MSSSTKSEVSHDPREIEPKHRRSSRLHRKHPGSHSRKSSTSTEAKIPKIVKSYSSTGKTKMEAFYSLNKGSSKVIKSHEGSENSNSKRKSKSSSKMSFWCSPDLSPGVGKLFHAMNLCEIQRFISVYLLLMNNI
jgi:hypothetical protein